MSGKTISAGTLGLRFMQNAQRAKQRDEAETEGTHVSDDGHWEVAQAVRDAWGPASSSLSSRSVTLEPSYLPFLFPSLPHSSEQSAPSDVTRPKGRRAFGKTGQEIIQERQPDLIVASTDDMGGTHEKSGTGSKAGPRSVSISNLSGAARGFKPPRIAKTAKEIVFKNDGVGTDLGPPSAVQPSVFLKPSGVDDPTDTKSSTKALETPIRTDIIVGTRDVKLKREHTILEGEGTKRKKKKRKLINQ